MNEGINSENLVPELILDKRNIIEIKKHASSLKPIFVVHKQHFDNYIVKYRDGMKYLYQIQFVMTNESENKENVNATLYQINSYYDSFLCRAADQNLYQIRSLLNCNGGHNLFINERYEYFKFLDNFMLLISKHLEKSKTGEKWITFEMFANPSPVFEMLERLDIDFIKNYNKSKFGTCRTIDFEEDDDNNRTLRVKQEFIARNVIEIMVNDVKKLFPFFGSSYYEHVFKKPNYHGSITMLDNIVSIDRNNSNITIGYDIINFILKFKAKISSGIADDSGVMVQQQLQAEVNEIKFKLLDKDFYDPMMKVFIVDIISCIYMYICKKT